jgi:hypothetical protein
MANVVIDIAAEFTGNKAFKQAETSTDKLIKSTKRLAGAVGLAFGTTQILAFGKASVKAALEAQAQQQRLAQLVKVTVGASDEQIQSLNEQAEALQKIGVVNKENITQTQSQLATFNLQVDTIKALTPAILDYVTAEKGAAASADQFKQMTNGLAQALNGNFASLTKVGFVLDEATKKTIKSGTESERAAALVKVLDSTYKDFNKSLADTPTGQMQKLTNAADDAKQVIGTGLLDAMKELGGANGIGLVTDAIDELALGLAESIVSTSKLVKELKELPVLGDFLGRLISNPLNLPKEFLAFGEGGLVDAYRSYSRIAGIQKATDNAHLKSLNNQFTIIRKTTDLSRKLTTDELKKLKAAKLKQAIDKANLALLKGEEVFDMDKIQIAAALTNQAEQLGKATTSSQVLQIANDTARLNVKKSILALEDAIASKDEAAITSATNKLNADLKILNALSGQNIKMQDIKSILDSLKPKDLINQANLDEALRKIKEMMALLAQANTQANAKVPTSASLGSGIPAGDYIAPIPMSVGLTASTSALIEASEAIQARADAFTMLLDLQTKADTEALAASSLGAVALNTFSVEDVARSSLLQGLSGGAGVAGALSGSRYAAQAANQYNISVQANTIANPEELTNLIQNSIIQLNRRGDYLTTAGAL